MAGDHQILIGRDDSNDTLAVAGAYGVSIRIISLAIQFYSEVF
jgi:hypothetical protein